MQLLTRYQLNIVASVRSQRCNDRAGFACQRGRPRADLASRAGVAKPLQRRLRDDFADGPRRVLGDALQHRDRAIRPER